MYRTLSVAPQLVPKPLTMYNHTKPMQKLLYGDAQSLLLMSAIAPRDWCSAGRPFGIGKALFWCRR